MAPKPHKEFKMGNFNEVVSRIKEWRRDNYLNAPEEHHKAFLYAIAYGVTGQLGGFSPLSMRMVWACRILDKKRMTGCCSFEEACKAIEESCYGQLTTGHLHMSQLERCEGDFLKDIVLRGKALKIIQKRFKSVKKWLNPKTKSLVIKAEVKGFMSTPGSYETFEGEAIVMFLPKKKLMVPMLDSESFLDMPVLAYLKLLKKAHGWEDLK